MIDLERFNKFQLKEIKLDLENGDDVKEYAKTEIYNLDMKKIRLKTKEPNPINPETEKLKKEIKKLMKK